MEDVYLRYSTYVSWAGMFLVRLVLTYYKKCGIGIVGGVSECMIPYSVQGCPTNGTLGTGVIRISCCLNACVWKY